MLTPAFELSQDRDFLTVAIRVPHARASEFDVYFEGVDFKFYAKPYFLRRVPAACALRLLGNPRSWTHSRGSRPCLGGFSLARGLPRNRLLPHLPISPPGTGAPTQCLSYHPRSFLSCAVLSLHAHASPQRGDFPAGSAF